jgi:hypothetical protein
MKEVEQAVSITLRRLGMEQRIWKRLILDEIILFY